MRLPAVNTARAEGHAQLDEQTRYTSLHDSTHTAHRALIAKAVTGSCYLRPVWRVAHRVAAEGFPVGFPNEAPEAQAADTLRRQSAPYVISWRDRMSPDHHPASRRSPGAKRGSP